MNHSKQKNLSEPVTPFGERLSYEGFLMLSNAIFKPQIFLGFTGNELKLALYLTFLRCKFAPANGRLTLAASYLVNGTNLSEGSIKRLMKSLQKKQFLKCTKVNKNWRTSKGNEYVVYTIFLWDKSKPKTDQVDPSIPKMIDQFDPNDRSKRSVVPFNSGMTTDQNDLQSNTNIKIESGAVRCAAPNHPAGGVEMGNKGIRLTADDFRKDATGIVEKYDAEIQRRQREKRNSW